jgi:hypothetical protein
VGSRTGAGKRQPERIASPRSKETEQSTGREQAATDRETSVTAREQQLADIDQTGSDRDQAAADRDQVASDREVAHGGNAEEHRSAREARAANTRGRRETTRERFATTSARGGRDAGPRPQTGDPGEGGAHASLEVRLPVSLSAAAVALGVAPATLRRWADSGRVPCDRTAGGHRRFDVSKVRDALGPIWSSNHPTVKGVEPPTDPLPAGADLLLDDGPALIRLAAKMLYHGLSGWWSTELAIELSVAWTQAVALCLQTGDYAPSFAATQQLMRQAGRAGASLLERHRFLDHFSTVLIRGMVDRRTMTPRALRTLRRLFISLQQTLLENEPPGPAR